MAGFDGRIEELVREYGRMLVRLAASRLSSVADAEDVVQDVFCALVSKRPEFSDAEHAKAWLVRATINRAADVRRRAARRNVPLDEAAPVPDAAAASAQSDLEMLACVRSLPDKYATVLHLHYYEGYSLREIAVLLGVPAATVGTRLARGRARLRAILKEESL
ncbi:RNA polymerase sigma factor [Adlercreutzia caecimuris]|uniref:RNA polymerase sigma factor n=1 Tax=Adlercreutzia caecimuris TaxID=671266 RepID=UPI00272C7F66|nr:sigma-70 family RNA polymerase sigma factor [Adlercreutzia caecimuris]